MNTRASGHNGKDGSEGRLPGLREALLRRSTDLSLDDFAACGADGACRVGFIVRGTVLSGLEGYRVLSMSGAAQQQEEIVDALDFTLVAPDSVPGLKQVASERIQAHRRRRAEAQGAERAIEEAVEAVERQPRARTSRVREAVAARYQNSVTYREFLEQARAEAEIAARQVQAVAEAQIQLLEELQQWEDPAPLEFPAERRGKPAPGRGDISVAMGDSDQPPPVGMSKIEADAAMPSYSRSSAESAAATEVFTAGLTVRLYEDLSAIRPPIENVRRVPMEADQHEATALDAEIAFRRAPEFEPHHPEPVGIAGNLIEFPRQLVAARKVRPRLAEGPLREESAPEPQLRIFEVEAEQISAAPAEPASAPEWQSILLEGAPAVEVVTHVEAQFQHTLQPQTAPLELRLMAASVDGCCVGAALVGFMAVAGEIAGPQLKAMPLPIIAASVALVGCLLFVMYQMLFFSLGEATPGMRYARIGLCTFGDGNPTRAAMRRRVLAILLAACPLGLGIAWAWMDEDSLGWHDRISRMYQRAY
jgi:hypothetical protein